MNELLGGAAIDRKLPANTYITTVLNVRSAANLPSRLSAIRWPLGAGLISTLWRKLPETIHFRAEPMEPTGATDSLHDSSPGVIPSAMNVPWAGPNQWAQPDSSRRIVTAAGTFMCPLTIELRRAAQKWLGLKRAY